MLRGTRIEGAIWRDFASKAGSGPISVAGARQDGKLCPRIAGTGPGSPVLPAGHRPSNRGVGLHHGTPGRAEWI